MATKTRRAGHRPNMLNQMRNARMRAAAEGSPRPVAFFWDDPELLTVDSGENFEIHFNDMIDDWFGISSAMIAEALVVADGRDVLVHLNSPGGMYTEGLAIRASFAQYGGNVTFRVAGLAASAASFVMLAGNRIEITPGSLVMIHDAWDFTSGDAATHRKTADLLDKVSDSIADMYATKAGGEPGDWRALMREETWYAGQEAVDAGLVDAFISDTGDVPAEDDTATTASAATNWRGVFDLAPRRPVDLGAPPPVLPEGLDRVDLASVAALAAQQRTLPIGTPVTTEPVPAPFNAAALHEILKGLVA
jgi:ATP-dependent protease ClpP protease subunit